MAKAVLTVRLGGVSGTPPTIERGKGDYVGYFENEYGEQAVFHYSASSRRAILHHCDLGWEPHEVIDGRVPDIILNDPERAWLTACWVASAIQRTGKFGR